MKLLYFFGQQNQKTEIFQWNKIGNPDINPHVCGLMIFHMMPCPFSGKRTVFSANGIGMVNSNKQENKLGHLLKPCKKINYKWIRNLNVRAKIMKFFEENSRNMQNFLVLQ